ncbi:MerR family transcriptional regulator [Massilia sp. BJB1822]|uniref:MerR family transcriptional regulator n=1 Tax=Massilia sp. BJB1822 TaxID=2744470 RepID=UPI0015948637|nr:MerR family transcriptional regulator [Massilia sp. BJB1822]NVD98260.1 MerR family transcriptional regulator [Massilia sp. BJB1822]
MNDNTALKIGELAKRTGLTVRALHHYDSIGLLKPSARSDSGYRLYNVNDVARLHQIQALRRFGIALSDIAAMLDDPAHPLADTVARQIEALEHQIEQASLLRRRLKQLQGQLQEGEAPELAGWLRTMELMAVYDRYFSKEELARLPFQPQDRQRNRSWAQLVAQVRSAMAEGQAAESEASQALARRWMEMLEKDTASDPATAARIAAMMAGDAGIQYLTGVTPEVTAYVMAAFSAFKLAIYARYLDAEELQHLRVNSGRNREKWLDLIARVQRQMDADAAPSAPATQALAGEWQALFRAYAGDNPQTQAKMRRAQQEQPVLLTGTWMKPEMLAYVRSAMAALPAQA